MLKSKNKSGKRKRVDITLDTGIVKKAKEILKRRYNETNFSGLVDWQLDKFIDDETALDILEKGLKRNKTDEDYEKFVKDKINSKEKSNS